VEVEAVVLQVTTRQQIMVLAVAVVVQDKWLFVEIFHQEQLGQQQSALLEALVVTVVLHLLLELVALQVVVMAALEHGLDRTVALVAELVKTIFSI
jgi:hypothetical protein